MDALNSEKRPRLPLFKSIIPSPTSDDGHRMWVMRVEASHSSIQNDVFT